MVVVVAPSRGSESRINASAQSESEGDGGSGQEALAEAVLWDGHAIRSNSDASRQEQKHQSNIQNSPMTSTIFV
jgi:hypothetical protein